LLKIEEHPSVVQVRSRHRDEGLIDLWRGWDFGNEGYGWHRYCPMNVLPPAKEELAGPVAGVASPMNVWPPVRWRLGFLPCGWSVGGGSISNFGWAIGF
jgi:hypothetical protein